MIKRFFDIFFSSFGLILLFPFFLIISIFIKLGSKGPIFYKQIRVGKYEKDFLIFKFRTMHIGSDKSGLLTIGSNDSRITKVGLFLRKYKLDELPQLINVFIGNMSLVGPRPEVRKYVDLYNVKQLEVLNVKPGITDYASIIYFDENTLLGESSNPDNTYIFEIMPKKLDLNIKYINEWSIFVDFKIVFKTIRKIFIL